MKLHFFMGAVLLLWAAVLSYGEGPLYSYMEVLQEKSRTYSVQLQGAPQDKRQDLLTKYKRELQLESEKVLSQWEMDGVEKKLQLGEGGNALEEYTRQVEQLAEIYVSRYMEPYLEKHEETHPEMRTPGEGADQLLARLSSELQLYHDGQEPHLSTLERWEEAEYSLLDKRMEWERNSEELYLSQLESIKEEYERTDGQYRQRLEKLAAEYQEGIELWDRRKLDLHEGLHSDLEQLEREIKKQQNETGELMGELMAAYAGSQALIRKAEAQLYEGNSVRYWARVRSRELTANTQIENAWNTYISRGETIPSDLLDENKNTVNEQLEKVRGQVTLLQALVDFMELPAEQRELEELREKEKKSGVEYIQSLAQEGILSEETSEAYSQYIRQGMKLSLGEESEGRIYTWLSSELEKGQVEYARIQNEYDRLCKEISDAHTEAENSKELLRKGADIRRQAELKQIVLQLEQAGDLIDGRQDEYRTHAEEGYFKLYAKLADILPLLKDVEDVSYPNGGVDGRDWTDMSKSPGPKLYAVRPDKLQQDALIWAQELEKERNSNRFDSFLKDCALALYHQNKTLVDPGYCSSNQSYNKLQSKLGSSADEYLKDEAEAAYKKLMKDDREKRLYKFYLTVISTHPGPSQSVLSKAAVEDLGKVLFKGIVDHAGRTSASLKKKREEYRKKAKVYAGIAAACYASMNIPGGAAMTALAASYSSKASDVKAKRDDINALKQSMESLSISGSQERREAARKIASVAGQKKEICRTEESLESLTSAVHTKNYWRKLFAKGSGDYSFTGFFKADPFGAAPLQAFMKEKGGSKKYTLTDYIDQMIKSGKKELEETGDVRVAVNEEVVKQLTECAAPGEANPRDADQNKSTYKSISKKLAESKFYVEHLCAEDQGHFYLSGGADESDLSALFTLVQLMGNIKRLKARREAAGLSSQLDSQKALWEQQMNLIKASVQSSREDHLEDLRKAGVKWDREFRENYVNRQQSWEKRVHTFHQTRTVWLQKAINAQARQLSARGAEALNMDPEAVVDRLSLVPLDHLPRWEPPHSMEYEQSSRETLDLFAALESAELEGIIPELEKNRREYDQYRSKVRQMYNETSRRAEKVAFETGMHNFSAALEEYQKEFRNTVGKANQRVADSLHTLLVAAGFQKRGTSFQRNALVDLTYFKHERELQSVESYRDYQLPELRWGTKIQQLLNQTESIVSAEAHYEQLLEEMEAQRALVFGGYDTKMEDFLGKVDEQLQSNFTGASRSFAQSAAYKSHNDMEGLFNWHVGYAPKMDESDPEKIEIEGYGETGRILTDFYVHEASLGRALAMMDTAAWDRRLWDDDRDNDGNQDGWLKAASIRSVSDLTIKTAATLGLGPGAAVLAGLVDDAFFALADTRAGYKTWDEAMYTFGSQALVQSASLVSAGAWENLTAVPGWEQQASLFRNILPAAGKTASEKLIEAGSAGIEYTHSDGFSWNEDRFRDVLFDSSTAVDIGLSAMEAYSDAALHNMVSNREHTYGFTNENIVSLTSGIDTGQDILSGGLEYALKGETTYNLFGIGGSGLLELHLSQDSPSLALGSNGRSISPEKLVELYRGAALFGLQQRIEKVGRKYKDPLDQQRIAEMLRFQSAFGDERSQRMMEKIFDGDITLRLLDQDEFRGQTRLGNDGSREILISLSQHEHLGSPSLALTLQHEAHRDGIFSPGNDRETLKAVMAHTAMAAGIYRDPLYGSDFLYKDSSILQDMAALAEGDRGIAALMSAYDSGGDYWRITSEGNLLWDGSHHLWGENGILLETHAPGSFSQDVADYMGISRPEALELMQKAGFMWNESLGTYEQGKSTFNLKVKPELQAQYALLRSFAERTNSTVPVSDETAYAWALRDHYCRETLNGGADPEYTAAMDKFLSSPELFKTALGISGGTGFDGIRSTGTLREYSQQWLESAVSGEPLEASSGRGYCLAESIAAHYVDTFSEVDWDDIEHAFSSGGWGESFDTSTGWVGDKREFSAELSKRLGVDARVTEYRFDSLNEVNSFLEEPNSGVHDFDDVSFIADYGTHFTHVRQDGIELNSYNGWSAPEEGPQGWRVYGWDFAKQ